MMGPSPKAAYISSFRLTRPKQTSRASVTFQETAHNATRVRISFCRGVRVLCTLGLFAFLALNALAQGLLEIQPVAPDHQFTDADLAGKWYTLRDEALDFQPGGILVYTKASEASREGGWFVSNGTVWLTWQGEGGVPVMAMRVTAFNAERIHLEGLGGKSRAVFVRQKPLVKSQILESRLSISPKSGGIDSKRPEISIASSPHLDYHGGPVVDHPKLHLMYWSTSWDSIHSDPAFKKGAIDTWSQAYMSSNYFNVAGQYGVHSGNLDSSATSAFGDPGGSTNSVFIHGWATLEIETPFTGVPYPCGNDLYAVMLPKGTTIDNGFNKTCGSFGAYHLFAPILVPPSVCGFLDPFFPEIRFVPYTIIPVDCATKSAGPNGFYQDVDELTSLISHETIEAMTDPIDSFASGVPVIGGILNAFLGILGLSPGFYDNGAPNFFTDSEAADICEKRAAKNVWLNNSLVSSYWSNNDNDCAAGPGVVRTFSLLQTGVPSGTPVLAPFDTRVPDVNPGFTINVATNTVHSYSYPSPISGGAGTRYVTNQPPGNVLVTDNFSVTAPYTTQYLLTVNTNPAAAATGNASLTPSGWYDKGPFTIHSDQTVAVASGTRYNFNSWSGGISANTHDFAFTLDGPKTATANYALQYLVNFTETGIPPGPVWNVNVDGTSHVGPFPDWVNAGTTLHYAYDKVVVGVPGTCYVLGGVSPASPLAVIGPTTVTGTYSTQTVPQAIVNYQFVSMVPAAAGLSFVTFKADVVNCGPALGSVTGMVKTLDPFTVRIAPGQETLTFAPVAANSEVTSNDTFTVLMNGALPLDPTKLVWTFGTVAASPVANPGPDQTVTAGTTVILDGTGSTNPSGMGSLTYDWRFTSRPPGSTAKILFSSTAMAQFVANAPGVYVVMLTVSNGTMSSSSSVTITATP
jgi:hypothetical protein